MARLRKNETSINITSAAAAPARRKTVAAPRKRTATASSAVTEPEAQDTAVTGDLTAAPIAEGLVTAVSPVVSSEAAVELSPAQHEIAALAYSYYVERGYTEGCPEHDWLRAEADLRQRALATA